MNQDKLILKIKNTSSLSAKKVILQKHYFKKNIGKPIAQNLCFV